MKNSANEDFPRTKGGKARETPSERSVSKENVTSVLMEEISCTTWDEKINGMNYQPQLVQDFFQQYFQEI